MLRSLLSVTLYIFISSSHIAAAVEPGDRLIWFGFDWKPVWTVDLNADGRLMGRSEDLLIPPGSRRVPELEVDLVGGGLFTYSPEKGDVLLVDFWASWCTPCLVELPHLQKLHDAEKDNGLAVLAVNISDTEKVASDTAARLGLTVPVALMSDEIDRFFEPKSLPAMVLADRRGMIRKRWNGYESGLEREIASTARQLLGDSGLEQQEKYGSVHQGMDVFRVRWTKKFETEIEGLAVAAPDEKTLFIHVSTDRNITTIRADGEQSGTIRVPPGMGRLLSSDVNGDSLPDLVGYRRGNARVGIVDLDTGKASSWIAPGKVREMAIFPSADGTGEIVLATQRGAIFATAGGSFPRGIAGDTLAVGALKSRGGRVLVMLEADGPIRLEGDGRQSSHSVSLPVDARRLVLPPEGQFVGVASGSLESSSYGRFLGGDRRLLALGTGTGQLVVVDPEDGEIVFRASVPKVVQVTAADLDGDGRDELVVGSTHMIAVLEGTSGISGKTTSDE